MHRYYVRRALLADATIDPKLLRAALIITEAVDWRTRENAFPYGDPELNDWLNGLAILYRIDIETLGEAFRYLLSVGLTDIRGEQGALFLSINAEAVQYVPAHSFDR